MAGAVNNILYDGSPTIPTNAGTYAVTADFTPTDTANYNSLSAAAAGNFTIDKATPTLSVTNSPVTYNGSPQAADVTGSVPGAVSNILYDGSPTIPTNAGTYAVTADFAPTDSTNYNSLTAAAAGNFTIDKATPTLSVTNSPVTYNGSPQAADVTGSVPGAVSNILYDGSPTIPTNAGTYAVTADFAPTDSTNYNSLTAAAAGNFTIDKATPTLSVTNSPVTYNGSSQAAAVTGSVTGAVSAILYDGSATEPTDAGPYAVTADFADR
ncbi:MAG: MBG domain-containing protein [Caldilineaceae bacterium]